ncbi:Ero1 protein [Candida orthopsilosis Co 90-125]|uniref:Ero1 protein n=1 Tax=Candida orthopsilosis (strain 90-125) TaxID=1136231 RepID=H8X9X0_CANO9|nr:Ero1 protein [Candida orthopsilosis Co 90-125]CCG24787.1 Ero1 protein [Candida orthopsilosis Co 90-125]
MHLPQWIILLISFFTTSILASTSFSSQHQVNPHVLPKVQFHAFDSPEFCSQIITSSCNTTFAYLDQLNQQIRPSVTDLVQTPYFRYFKVDLDKQCKFWNAQHFCATENCAVEVIDDFNWSQVTNDNLKPSKLGKIKLAMESGAEAVGEASNSIDNSIETEPIEQCEDLDYSYFDDEHEHNCVYVNLLQNPERFTGYGGNQSFDVWKAIYSENCFPNTNPMSMKPNEPKEKCVEKNLFYRLVSGMHASIAVHLSNEYLDSETGEFYPNLQVFMQRVGSFNDRLANIYFNYALVAQSLVKLNHILPLRQFIQSGYDDITPAQKQHLLENNDLFENAEVYDDLLLQDIIPALGSNTLFNTSTLFDPTKDPNLKQEFRARFKNISAIMDCVGCDRCRMWGKIQTIGYGTALKILFEDDENNQSNLKFRRIEIVALINTFDRLSKSIAMINNFKQMYIQHLQDVVEGKAQPGQFNNNEKTLGQGFHFPFVNSLPKQPQTSKQQNHQPHSSLHKPSNSDSTSSRSSTHQQSPPQQKKSIFEIYEIPTRNRTFNQELKLAFYEVWEALKFVLGSYKEFPVVIGKVSLGYLNNLWNNLIGKPAGVREEYRSPLNVDNAVGDEHQQYLNLINEED